MLNKEFFGKKKRGGVRTSKDGPITFLPSNGHQLQAKPLTFSTIMPSSSLVDVFCRIEDILHSASLPKEKRYEVIFQLLLAKIFDEHDFETRPEQALDFQDFAALGHDSKKAFSAISELVKRAVTFYQNHLPNQIKKDLEILPDTVSEVCKVLAPIKVTASSRSVVQTFYMKFAKDMYKWDMAQYFTPPTITDFVIEVLNPQFGEHVVDPACGSADFLVGAFRYARHYNPAFADSVWGFDVSKNAVQVAVLNMLLNGDGKSRIKEKDSLENIGSLKQQFDVVVCNPPFGVKIVERREKVLKKFDLGHELCLSSGYLRKKKDEDKNPIVLAQQECGILFIEACIKMCRLDSGNGRIAIVVPNGYLGNTSEKYRYLREWLLRNARIAAIVSLPRFSFKQSGADVSASILFLEKRDKPLSKLEKTTDYCFSVQMVQKVGWDAGKKTSTPEYKRNPEDGSYIVENGSIALDSDFESVLSGILNSKAGTTFPWLLKNRETQYTDGSGWSVTISSVLKDPHRSLDPKYLCSKATQLRNDLLDKEHFLLTSLVDFIPEMKSSRDEDCSIDKKAEYRYLEIKNINSNGDFHPERMKGWQLPNRARHFAEPGDLYFGSIWGSVSKWCVIPDNTDNLVVTNGCFRARFKEGMLQYKTDLVSFMTTESWAIQLRSLSRGSDGLASINTEDLKSVVIPKLNEEARNELNPFVDDFFKGKTELRDQVRDMSATGTIEYEIPAPRNSHIVLV